MSVRPEPSLAIHLLLVERAQRKLGVLSRKDLYECGLSPQAVRRWIVGGKLVEIFPGAFVLPGGPLTWKQKLMCGLTWGGPSARVSHRSAASLLRLEGFPEGRIELTSTSKKKPPDGIDVHVVKRLWPYDTTTSGPFRTSTPARTILDLGAVSDIDTVEYALEDLLRRKVSTLPALRWELRMQGGRGVRGGGILSDLLNMRPEGYVPTGSRLEIKIDRELRALVLPPYERQHVLATRIGEARPDFAFPDFTFAIEGYSYTHHGGRRAWERDGQRHKALTDLGWDVLYVTWEDIHERREQFVTDVYTGLARKGWTYARFFL